MYGFSDQVGPFFHFKVFFSQSETVCSGTTDAQRAVTAEFTVVNCCRLLLKD